MVLKKWNVYAAWALSAMLCVSLNACGDDDDEALNPVETVPGNDGNETPDDGGETNHPEEPEFDLAGHEAVDLGLPSGTLWATMNLGATAVEDYGKQYSWGETEEKSAYDIYTYKYCQQSYTTLTKYSWDRNYGEVDNKTVLEPEDDAAQTAWGGSWRMPTQVEMQELIDECTSLWTVRNETMGRLFTGPNGNSIFFPASGYHYTRMWEERGTNGYYWTSSLSMAFCINAHALYFDAQETRTKYYDRFVGFSIRPVAKE